MTVHVECRPSANDENSKARIAKELTHHIKSIIGISTLVNVKAPGELPRSSGKAQRIIDNRPKR